VDLSDLDGASSSKRSQANALPKPKRKHKIVIHSSPYLRCIQTSTAIAAGISQFQPPTPPPKPEALSRNHAGPDKILLRIDAFLGEWLSPDYFEDITPPPNSTMMVASAKADLLRRVDNVEVQHNVQNSQGHFPGGWRSPAASVVPSRKDTQDGCFPSLDSLAQALSHRERASSQGSASSIRLGVRRKSASPLPSALKIPDHSYIAPVPSYAVSPMDPIPRGYVAHARDACINVDFQWDSMRPPQEWGDGGEYGDEWSTMHKRFRRGLAGMMSWYKEHRASTPKDSYPGFLYSPTNSGISGTSRHYSEPAVAADSVAEDEENDQELVLVLVTHGAGCNALLGAISNQPVLLDVGQASLSMAVRREQPHKPSVSTPTARRSSVVDVGMSNEYEMKIIASTDHLRPGADPTRIPQPQSPAVIASPTVEYRRRFNKGSTNSSLDSIFTNGEGRPAANSSLGSIRRTSSSGSSQSYMNKPTSPASPLTGLWGGARPPVREDPIDGRRSPGADMVLNFSQPKTPAHTSTPVPISSHNQSNGNVDTNATAKTISHTTDYAEEHDDVPPLQNLKPPSRSNSGLWGAQKAATTSGGGLWGPPRLEELAERERGHKRRWTVTEVE
jgi:broad specificity phosphatase PhoE